jgi:hypothetical protein
MSVLKRRLVRFLRASRGRGPVLLLRLAAPLLLGSLLAAAVGILAADSSTLAKAAGGFAAGLAALIAGRFRGAQSSRRDARRAPAAA